MRSVQRNDGIDPKYGSVIAASATACGGGGGVGGEQQQRYYCANTRDPWRGSRRWFFGRNDIRKNCPANVSAVCDRHRNTIAEHGRACVRIPIVQTDDAQSDRRIVWITLRFAAHSFAHLIGN